MESETAGKGEKEEGCRDEGCMEARDFGVKSRDIGNGEEADE